MPQNPNKGRLKGVKPKRDPDFDFEPPYDTPRGQGLVSRKEPGDEWTSRVDYDVERASAEHISDKGVRRGMTHGYKFDIDDARNKLGNPPRPPGQSEAEYRHRMRSSYTGKRYSGTAAQQDDLETQEKMGGRKLLENPYTTRDYLGRKSQPYEFDDYASKKRK